MRDKLAKKDILVAAVEELRENDASEVYVTRITTTEALVPQKKKKITFHIRMWKRFR